MLIPRIMVDKGMISYYTSARLSDFVLGGGSLVTNKRIEQLHKINYLTAEMNGLYHHVALKQGLSDSVSMVLYSLLDRGGSCLLSQIYKDSGISKQTVNSAIRKLEADGVLYLEAVTGRSKKVLLTEKGMELASNTVGRLMKAEVMAFEGWSDQEVETHVGLMERYLEDFRSLIERIQEEL